ncbi:MAG TPA: hypothetical protein DCG72_03760 [Gammaproteobacteria bacterium]|nr:hypothetical protein [Gammaproteobacteria bacterium]
MAVNPQSGSLLGTANTPPQPDGTQVAGIRLPPAVTRRVTQGIDKLFDSGAAVADQTGDNVLSRARKKSQELQEQRTSEPEVNTTEPAPAEAAPAPETNPIPTEPAPVASDEVDLNANPIDETSALEAPNARAAVLETPDPYARYINVTDEEGQILIAAPKEREALLEGGLTDFNSEKMVDEAGVLERIETISQLYAGKINEDKRGVITLQTTRQMADLIGAVKSGLKKWRGPYSVVKLGKALRSKGWAWQKPCWPQKTS